LTGSRSFANNRLKRYFASACDFDFLFATQRVNDQVLAELAADKAGRTGTLNDDSFEKQILEAVGYLRPY